MAIKARTRRPVKAATKHRRAKALGLALMGGYDAQLAKQGGGCAICGQPPGARRLHVDHDHLTGTARGLCCWACNATIGRARENTLRLFGSAIYLTYGWSSAVTYRDAALCRRLTEDDT